MKTCVNFYSLFFYTMKSISRNSLYFERFERFLNVKNVNKILKENKKRLF